MKLTGKYISGDYIEIDNITKGWTMLYLSPNVFYTKYDEYKTAMDNIDGIYTDYDIGVKVVVKFQNEQDVDIFKTQFEYA